MILLKEQIKAWITLEAFKYKRWKPPPQRARGYRTAPLHHCVYMITVTPKGKLKTHSDYEAEVEADLCARKNVLKVWLFKEFKTTCHFHGWVVTRRPCALQFRSTEYVLHNDGIVKDPNRSLNYMLKDQSHGSTYLYVNRYERVITNIKIP